VFVAIFDFATEKGFFDQVRAIGEVLSDLFRCSICHVCNLLCMEFHRWPVASLLSSVVVAFICHLSSLAIISACVGYKRFGQG
jgi:Fe-S-cluster-containing dehydrogenase component